ncbi:hypothetical protein [Nocardioides pelophilus]|uniref:hypothetical protein n=1 Tax=Nocardioides pelophilus TaxID=2172019 RepID=UPI001603440A|nr:hypothetical protein [Nocardioides pelophilus]
MTTATRVDVHHHLVRQDYTVLARCQVTASLTTTDGRPLGTVEATFDDAHNRGDQP